MSDFISCYNEKKELEHFKVPEPIFVYIRQLEDEINYGMGGVQKLYPGRFNGKFFDDDKLTINTSDNVGLLDKYPNSVLNVNGHLNNSEGNNDDYS